ncbi:MAG: hypothetical protein P1Q69_14515 [Candidatus Thorarchaeota archaeon]|nr:hypothetical protein [Candidatus Thorarchaeota archaeon]
MELGTFGAVMKFALELETEALGYYERALEKVVGDELKSLLTSLRERCSKRILTLERIRRENVTEMILEPIKGFESDSYSFDLDVPQSENDGLLCETAIAIEELRNRFYEKGSVKIEFLIEAATAFDRLADENHDNMASLRLAL